LILGACSRPLPCRPIGLSSLRQSLDAKEVVSEDLEMARVNRDPQIVDNARGLRQNMTSAETLIWSMVRRSQFGCRFRRQEPIGAYIVDFLSPFRQARHRVGRGPSHWQQRRLKSGRRVEPTQFSNSSFLERRTLGFRVGSVRDSALDRRAATDQANLVTLGKLRFKTKISTKIEIVPLASEASA